jgi:hypothetical protein
MNMMSAMTAKMPSAIGGFQLRTTALSSTTGADEGIT